MSTKDDDRAGSAAIKALWIFAAVILGVGVVLVVGTQLAYMPGAAWGTGELQILLFTVAHVGNGFGPSMITAGLVAVALALAVQALIRTFAPQTPGTQPTASAWVRPSADYDEEPLDPQDVILGTTPGDPRRPPRSDH